MLTFLTFGDFGLNTPLRKEHIKMMKDFQKHTKVDAILTLGDNFYNYGVRSVRDPQWQDFERSYEGLECPFYAILGNHDYLGSVKAQIDYPSIKNDTNWKMPFRYYEKKFMLSDVCVHVFFLDTFTLSLNESRNCSVAMGMSGFDKLYPHKDYEQLRWLERNLEKSNATWKVVLGHYPIFSNGHHGDTPELIRDLLPILKKHNVDFYISGHDHDLEFMRQDDINFIVSGTGCSSNPVFLSHKSIYASDITTFGFNLLQFTQQTAKFGFITNNGQQIWFSVPKQKNVKYLNK